ncbi:hypothetical protein J3E69DRAFT_206955 [Trichoderma sp. SZMC 28015]
MPMQVVRMHTRTCASCRPLVDMPTWEVSCLLHLYQYDDATWVRPIHISAACVPGRVPVATDPCLQASSFCRQVRDTAQLALFHVSCIAPCIMYRTRRRGGGRVFRGILSRCQFTRQAAAGQSQRLGCPVRKACRLLLRTLMLKYEALLGRLLLRIHTSTLPLASTGRAGESHLQRGFV